MEALRGFLTVVLDIAIPPLILVLVIYLFRLRADSKRDRVVMYVTAVAYLLFLGMEVYALGSETGGCAGCGAALLVTLGLGFVIAIAAARMYGRRDQ